MTEETNDKDYELPGCNVVYYGKQIFQANLLPPSSGESKLDKITLKMEAAGFSNDEYTKACDETIETYLKVLSWYSPGKANEIKIKKPQSGLSVRVRYTQI
jgi:hypothetical protein